MSKTKAELVAENKELQENLNWYITRVNNLVKELQDIREKNKFPSGERIDKLTKAQLIARFEWISGVYRALSVEEQKLQEENSGLYERNQAYGKRIFALEEKLVDLEEELNTEIDKNVTKLLSAKSQGYTAGRQAMLGSCISQLAELVGGE